MSQINFNLGQGNSPGLITNYDGIQGLQLYGTAPGSFATTACQAVFSLADAVAKGIINDYADETAATGSVVISAVGSTGDSITLSITEKNPNGATTTVILATYKQAVGDTTPTLLAASIAAAINAQSFVTKYSASATSGTITITARKGLGINLNTVSAVATITGSITTGTITAFSGGVYSAKAIWYYHLSRVYSQNPNAKVWVQFTSSPTTGYTELQALLTASGGEPRKIFVYNTVAKTASTITSDVNLLQAQYTASFASYQPVDILFVPNIKAISDLSTLQNLQTSGTAPNVTVIISQDGAAAGAQLFVNSGVSISNLGDIMGICSLASPSQDIGEVGAFNMSDGLENNIPAFTNGVLVSAVNFTAQLETYRYLYCVTYTGKPGTSINNDWTSIVSTNAYNRISRNAVINKVLREQYVALLPLLKSRIYLNSDGTIDTATLNKYIAAAEPGIEQMVKDGDLSPGNISGTSLTTGVVSISPTQNVQTQGYVAITYNLLAVDIADNINVTLQFTQKL